jgi:hypothetical protein
VRPRITTSLSPGGRPGGQVEVAGAQPEPAGEEGQQGLVGLALNRRGGDPEP